MKKGVLIKHSLLKWKINGKECIISFSVLYAVKKGVGASLLKKTAETFECKFRIISLNFYKFLKMFNVIS